VHITCWVFCLFNPEIRGKTRILGGRGGGGGGGGMNVYKVNFERNYIIFFFKKKSLFDRLELVGLLLPTLQRGSSPARNLTKRLMYKAIV
jgi:hypothetical protein